jgi:hypothetical protein
MQRILYRLPDGELTFNHATYSNAWQKLAEPIEKATGTKLTGFDPALSFATPDFKQSFQLHLFEARLISEALRASHRITAPKRRLTTSR